MNATTQADTPDGNDFEAEPAEKRRVVVLISGNGSNLQALLDAQQHDELGGEVVAVISNQGDAYGLIRAKEAESTPSCYRIASTTIAKLTTAP